MPRFAYVDGRYLPHAAATVSMDDRGYQFGDGVYEVVTVHRGRLVDEESHLDRLERSLRELRIPWPVGRRPMRLIMRELLQRNAIDTGQLYLQITRGVAPRNHKFPEHPKSILVMTARPTEAAPREYIEQGVGVILIPDIRWGRCDIKTTALLPNVLGKQQAVEANAFEAWMTDRDGFITEGTSSNAWIITSKNRVVTRQLNEGILSGVTRKTILGLAHDLQIAVEERPFSADEAVVAAEAFITSASVFVIPVTNIDGKTVGNGRPGPVTRRLRAAYEDYMAKEPELATGLDSILTRTSPDS